jgi:hypothetical protein
LFAGRDWRPAPDFPRSLAPAPMRCRAIVSSDLLPSCWLRFGPTRSTFSCRDQIWREIESPNPRSIGNLITGFESPDLFSYVQHCVNFRRRQSSPQMVNASCPALPRSVEPLRCCL